MSDVLANAENQERDEFNKSVDESIRMIRAVIGVLISEEKATGVATVMAATLVAAEIAYIMSGEHEADMDQVSAMLDAICVDMKSHVRTIRAVTQESTRTLMMQEAANG